MTAPARWWTPSAPHIGPDQLDLLLLGGDDNPNLDLGSAVLAAHRVGAAALEVAAVTPLVSTETVINCLVSARALLADPLVDAVAKSTAGPVYAGLLVRDVLDDAEETAVAFFEQMVAKGVAPPLAASRAGAVFGVPASRLGRYRPLALDPRANPVALSDAADRALFTFAAALAEDEAIEDVAKVRRETPWVATEPRDPQGEWVRSQAQAVLSAMNAMPAEQETEAPAPVRQRRQRRQVRQQRQRRTVRAEQHAEQAHAQPARAQNKARTGPQKAKISRAQRKAAALVNPPLEASVTGPPPAGTPNPLDFVPEGSLGLTLDRDATFVLSEKQAQDWVKAMRKHSRTGDLAIRIGHIADQVGKPAEFGSEAHFQALQRAKDATERPEVYTEIVEAEDAAAQGGLLGLVDYLKRRTKDIATGPDGNVDVKLWNESRSIPIEGGRFLITRGLPPTVYEFVFRDQTDRVGTIATNQAFKAGKEIDDPERGWEHRWENGVLTVTVTFNAITNSQAAEIGKADRQTPWVATERRNERGEWARQAAEILGRMPTEPVEPPAPARQQRQVRQQRKRRQRRAVRETTSSAEHAMLPRAQDKAQNKATQKARSKATLKRRLATVPEAGYADFDATRSYTILSPAEWAAVAPVSARSGTSPDVITLDKDVAEGLVYNTHPGRRTETEIIDQYWDDVGTEGLKWWDDVQAREIEGEPGGLDEILRSLADRHTIVHARSYADGTARISTTSEDFPLEPLAVVDVTDVRGYGKIKLYFEGLHWIKQRRQEGDETVLFDVPVYRYMAEDPAHEDDPRYRRPPATDLG